MMQQALSDLLKKRRDRAIAIILTVKERDCDRSLTADAQAKLRKVVLDQLNEFYDVCCDIIASLDTGDVVLNDMYLSKIDELHNDVGEIRRLMERAS